MDENKAVNIPVPTKTSDLDNDSGYITEDQVNSKVTEGVASIVANAPEDFDTLKEMSDWISQHEDSAAAMNSSILKNKEDISSLYTSKADVSDVQTVEASVDELNSNLDGLQYSDVAGGKNLCSCNAFVPGIVGGISYTKNGDKILAVGTAVTSEYVTVENFVAPKDGTYSISISGNSNIKLILLNDSKETTSSLSITVTKGTILKVGLKRNNNVATNETVGIQIDLNERRLIWEIF